MNKALLLYLVVVFAVDVIIIVRVVIFVIIVTRCTYLSFLSVFVHIFEIIIINN